MSSATSGTSAPASTYRQSRPGTHHGGAAIHTCKPRTCYVQYPHSKPNTDWCAHCGQTIHHPREETPVNAQDMPQEYRRQPNIPPPGQPPPHPYFQGHMPHHAQYPFSPSMPFLPPQFALPPGPGIPRPHPLSQAQPLHDLGFGPTPLFGWASVTPRAHSYGQPKFWRHTKPDYRRYCFSVGKADVPYASLPGGPLEGYPAHMAPQLVGRW
jgi:hypothetical protein